MSWLYLLFYRAIWRIVTIRWLVFAPSLIEGFLRRRLNRGKELPERWREKLGEATLTAPSTAAPLIWLHAASVGELVSAIPLVLQLAQRHPASEILVTTGTVTSAQIFTARLSGNPRLHHQFLPLDAPQFVEQFLLHWRPSIALWLESEFWPNLLIQTRRIGCKIVLVNARLSPESLQRWRWATPLIAKLLSQFCQIQPQSQPDLARFTALLERCRPNPMPVLMPLGNLKLAAAPLPVDRDELNRLAVQFRSNPLWLAASTHAGEESIIATVHELLRAEFPTLVTIIVPRHPNRRDELMQQLQTQFPTTGLTLRSQNLTSDSLAKGGIYLADTLGELGLWYSLAKIVLVGGSLVPHGGQNPLEPLWFSAALVFGPHMENFSEIAEQLVSIEAAQTLPQPVTAASLHTIIGALLRQPQLVAKMGTAGANWRAAQQKNLEKIIVAIDSILHND